MTHPTLTEQLQTVMEALEFYSKSDAYWMRDGSTYTATHDFGTMAKAALATLQSAISQVGEMEAAYDIR